MFSYTLPGLGESLRICSTFIWITKSPKLQMSIEKTVKMNMLSSKLCLFCSISLKNSQDKKQNQTMMLY